MNALMPNTYSRRMTRYSAYDADAVTVRVGWIQLLTFLELKLFLFWNIYGYVICYFLKALLNSCQRLDYNIQSPKSANCDQITAFLWC